MTTTTQNPEESPDRGVLGPDDRPVLVLGGTGKTGRRVVGRLRAGGVPVRVGSRAAATAFDWAEPAGWPAVLAGARAVYLAYAPDLAVPGAPDTVGALAVAARASGVQRLVLLSGRGEPEAQRAEQAAAAAGPSWTVLRASWFAQNFSEGHLLPDVLSGQVRLPVNEVPEPFIDADDIAEVAAAALLQDGHAGRTYELTGPESLTFAQAVAHIAAATGRPVSFHPIALRDYTDGLAGHGVPDDALALLAYLFGEVLDGRNAQPGDGVRQALGRPARSFAEYAAAAAAAGAWDAPLAAAGRR